MAKKTSDKQDNTVIEKLKALWELQVIDSQIDKLKTVRGELPLEVEDLEDTVLGLETRKQKITDEVEALETSISDKKNTMKDAKALIKKYEGQQSKVRNNREFDSLNKEIEFQTLEIQLAEKRIKENKIAIEQKQELIAEFDSELKDRKKILKEKKSELDEIVAETEKDETALLKRSKTAATSIEERLLTAYARVRENAINGLAVVEIQRDACGGCFNKIPPQRQLDIRLHKKIIVCEHCGRIIVDSIVSGNVEPEPEEKPKKRTIRKKATAKKKATA